jgi:Zn-dependent M28 family amino/carboxypeptidase
MKDSRGTFQAEFCEGERMRKLCVLLSFVVLAVNLWAADPPAKHRRAMSPGAVALPSAALAALQTVDPEHIRWHVRFLAHDLLEGRGTGQRGGELAAEYIATQFALYGLKPAGDNGTYLQKVPMVGLATQDSTALSLVPEQGEAMPLRLKDDVVSTDESQQETSDVDAPIVFVGYGINAPEYNWDDYKGADLKGKVLLMLVNEPPSDDPKFFKGKALTYYGRWTYKYEEAARRGAVGVILVHKTEMASYGWEVVRNSWSGERSYIRGVEGPKLHVASWVQLGVARKLMASSGLDLDKMMQEAQSPVFHPVPLKVRLQGRMVTKVRPFDSSNVVAMLPGSDARRKNEAVLYTAHYDHFGIRPDMPGDNIFNGANDNATGCGILLEMARVFASAAQKPARSILFASVTAEEQGLRGSEYLGLHPPIPASEITLDLNFDDVPPIGEPEETEVSGSERTTFAPVVEATAKEFRLAIRPDARPEAGHYYRSDHFSLSRVGIPAFSVNSGMKFKGHPVEWGLAQAQEYTDKHYHQPSDEYHPEMDFRNDAVITRFGFALGWQAASLPRMIEWQHGDEFEAARKKSQGN